MAFPSNTKMNQNNIPSRYKEFYGVPRDNIEPLVKGWVKNDKGIWVKKEKDVKREISNIKTIIDQRTYCPNEDDKEFIRDNYFVVFDGFIRNPDVKDEYLLVSKHNPVFKEKILSITDKTELKNGLLPTTNDEFYAMRDAGHNFTIPRRIAIELQNDKYAVPIFREAILEHFCEGDLKLIEDYKKTLTGKNKKVMDNNFSIYLTSNEGTGLVWFGSVDFGSYFDCYSDLSGDGGRVLGDRDGVAYKSAEGTANEK